jgi:ABC-type transport system substrate-binding protein
MRTRRPLRLTLSILTSALWTLALAVAPAAAAPEGMLTVAVATFGNERWLPNLTPGAEDVVLKPMFENLLTRDPKTGELAPMLAERWKVADGGRKQWPTKPTYDPKVPWAQADAEKARKVRLALNLAVDKQAIMQRILGGLGTVVGSWLSYPNDPWATDALKKPYPYDPAKAKALLTEAG